MRGVFFFLSLFFFFFFFFFFFNQLCDFSSRNKQERFRFGDSFKIIIPLSLLYTRTIKALEDRLSKGSVSPIVNSQTGLQCHTTSVPHHLMHRSWMDRPKQAFCRCPKPLRPIKVQHPFAAPPLTRPLTLPPSTRNNQSSCLQTKQRLIALPTAPYLTSE